MKKYKEKPNLHWDWYKNQNYICKSINYIDISK